LSQGRRRKLALAGLGLTAALLLAGTVMAALVTEGDPVKSPSFWVSMAGVFGLFGVAAAAVAVVSDDPGPDRYWERWGWLRIPACGLIGGLAVGFFDRGTSFLFGFLAGFSLCAGPLLLLFLGATLGVALRRWVKAPY
jgi:hypothetical protein